MKHLLPLAALGAAFFALSGCATYADGAYAADSGYAVPYSGPHYGYDGYYGYEPGAYNGYYGSPYDGYYWLPYGAQPRRHEVQPSPRPAPRPLDPRQLGPGARYQLPYGPDRDPVDPRFAPGGRP